MVGLVILSLVSGDATKLLDFALHRLVVVEDPVVTAVLVSMVP